MSNKISKEQLNEAIMEVLHEMLTEREDALIKLMRERESLNGPIEESIDDWLYTTKAVIEESLGIDPVDEYQELISEEQIKMLELAMVLTEGVDDDAATELQLYIENDGQLYKQKVQPIIKNLARKMAKDQYDDKLAIKAWMYAVDDGAKKYSKEFSTGKDWNTMFTKATRLKVAEELRDSFYEEVEEMSYEFGTPDPENMFNKKRR